jgi:hypothetical protein
MIFAENPVRRLYPPTRIDSTGSGEVEKEGSPIMFYFLKSGFNQLANCIRMHMMDRSTLLAKILKATHCFNLLYFQRLMPWV